MSRSLLLAVVLGLFVGACLLTQSIVASQQGGLSISTGPGSYSRPGIAPATVIYAPVADPTISDPIPIGPEVGPEPVRAARSWGQEQLCGPPNSMQGGSIPTAWCPASADSQNEWIDVRYAEPVQPMAVLIYENLAPGAVSQIEFMNESGQWVTVWGDDPKPVDSSTRIINATVNVDFATKRVRVTLLSPLVDYYNEIDAVGLLDRSGSVHWVVAATASSSYAGDSSELRSLSPVTSVDPGEDAMEALPDAADG